MDDNEWVKKCMDYVVEGVNPRGRPKNVEEIVKADTRNLKVKRKTLWFAVNGE